MESLLNEPSLSPTKQIKNSRRKTYHLQKHPHQYQYQHQAARLPNILRQSSCGAIPHKYAPPPPHQLEMVHALAGGVFLNHFPKQYSHSSLPSILPTYHHQKIHQQPPLLPLPAVSKPVFHSLPPPPLTRNHSLPYPLPKKQPSKTKMNPSKKSTTPTKNPKKDVADKSKAGTKGIMMTKNGSSLVENDQPSVGPAKGAKPGPVSTPKEASRVLKAVNDKNEIVNEKEKYFSTTLASVFSISPESPPPSSLPLPKFPLRKTLSLVMSF